MRKLRRIFKNYQKRKYIKKFKSYGENVFVDLKNSTFSFETIDIGNNVFIGSGAYFAADLAIGNNVMFGPRVTILGGDHIFGIVGKSVRFLKPKGNENSLSVLIEDEVWCGANVSILKGVKLGMGCVIGAGSVVTKEIPPYTVAVGNPCKPIKKIFTDEDLREHLMILDYLPKISEEVINRRYSLLALNGLNDLGYFQQIYEYTKM